MSCRGGIQLAATFLLGSQGDRAGPGGGTEPQLIRKVLGSAEPPCMGLRM